jgi:hypothetical protein
MPRATPDPRALAAEIIDRVMIDCHGERRLPYVIRLSTPPTARERLQLLAVRLQRSPVVIMPHKCKTTLEWIEQYSTQATALAEGSDAAGCNN